MPKEKAPRNRTIDTSISDGMKYIVRCIKIDKPVCDIGEVLDKTVIGTL